LKEGADLLYVLLGTFVSLGLGDQLIEAFERVHISNMSKLDENGKPIYREDGKVLKGPNYKSPNLEDLV
jgi:predicted HAD superfamily Cof-like phosphohydrolase